MDKIIMAHLVELSDRLDKAGKTQCSNVVDGLIEDKSVTKIAQYVGAIGYVLKQNRAMSNCIRKKRVANTGSMQEVVLDCLKEYQTGQEYGNNDWTAKYAQVIEDSPENFESSMNDLLTVVAKENNISDHIAKIREAEKILVENKVNDTLFKAISSDLDQIDVILKEGDVDHRPFKVAAPRSKRGFWSRLFSPSGESSGVQKYTELEMDNVLEGISTIARSAQQIRNSISAIQYQTISLGGYPPIVSAAQNLSPNDWNKTLQSVQALQTAVGFRPSDPKLFQISNLVYSISGILGNMYNQIEHVQRNMFHLRQRESVKGRTYGPSAAEEFGHLEMALERLTRNPLDEKALFYSQKLHGRLEDALNMRPTNLGQGFQDWIDTYQGPSQFEQPKEETIDKIQTDPSAALDPGAGTAQQLSQALGPELTDVIVRALEEIAQSDIGTEIEAQKLHHFIQELRTQTPDAGMGDPKVENTSAPGGPPVGGPPVGAPPVGAPPVGAPPVGAPPVGAPPVGAPPVSGPPVSGPVPGTAAPRRRFDHATILDEEDWNDIDDIDDEASTASKIETLVKIADIVDAISPEIADILDRYIEKQTKEEETFFEFPENALILKEEPDSMLKI